LLHGRQLVSIPLWFDSNLERRLPTCPLELVSIPLWFDSNGVDGGEAVPTITVFQFHSGSIQTIAQAWRALLYRAFQFHSGSIQTVLGKCRERSVRGFNSTLVRFKPGRRSGRVRLCRIVSIPLWFDSNESQEERAGHAARRFNSTLVRFKQNELVIHTSCLSWFQFHSGSIQTCPSPVWPLPCFSFNSTLVRFKPFYASAVS